MKTLRFPVLAAAFLFLTTTAMAGTGRVIIINADTPGVGFNDPTPAAPVGGNPGTTIGQQRLNVFQHAADRWTSVLDTNVNIRALARFAPQQCDETGAVLGSASATTWLSNFPNAPRQNVWYPIALANKFAGSDQFAGDDINITFNSAVDLPTCLGDRSWYYGFDGNEGNNDAMYPVVLHEIGHGLGMAARGTDFFAGRPAVFDLHTLDLTTGRTWDQMSLQERELSKVNTGKLVWNGENVTQRAMEFLKPATTLTVTAPAAVADNYDIGTAAFGPIASQSAVSGPVVAAVDAANADGPTTTDGCSPYSNAADIDGKIALVDRGVCTFVQKATNAQAAGAKALVIVDNRRETCLPPGMAGSDSSITIPVISLSQDDGNRLRQSAAVSAMLRVDPSRLAGASSQGFVRLYAPCTFEGGSSVYHWDTLTTPNLLMEPAINSDLLDTVDLTIYQLMDLGWTQPPRTGRRVLHR